MLHRKDYHLLFIIQQKTIAHNNLYELRFKIKIHKSKKHNFCGKNTHTDLIFAGVKKLEHIEQSTFWINACFYHIHMLYYFYLIRVEKTLRFFFNFDRT